MYHKFRWAAMVVAFSVWAPSLLSAQADTIPIHVDFSDLFEFYQEKGRTVQKLLGSVELHQDSVYMFCDSAFIFNELDVTAMSNVLIQQGDSISVFADSLSYQGAERLADLFGNVILMNGNQKLFTTKLHYDLNTRIATYDTGALLTNDTTQLISKRGYYYVGQHEIFFKDSVQIIDPNFELRTDTLSYNTNTQIARFLAPTLIVQDSSRIYCESGYYDVRNQTALFSQNPQYLKGETLATADSIRYDGMKKEVSLEGNAFFESEKRKATADKIRYLEDTEEIFLIGQARYESESQVIVADRFDFEQGTGLGIAQGNVVWQDTTQGLSIYCEQARYKEKGDYILAFGGRNNRPLMISKIDNDSLFLTADTLVAQRGDTLASDSSRMLRAYHRVRIFKSDLQALCDSLSYSSGDSLFRLYREPLIWSDTTQFSADTIHIRMQEKGVERIDLYSQSLIINSPDLKYFNQIKGKYIKAFFKEEGIHRMRVEGNAESLYYALDDSNAYIGVNQTACSEMLFVFAEKKLKEIKFYQEPSGRLIPMKEADHEKLKLEGFRWEYDRRPKSLEDLFQ
ncbi:MAG: hypothetical protein IPJ00_03440 [Saprospirales bacterium]|nr:hypothetical protein [Saprospirales bacterium]